MATTHTIKCAACNVPLQGEVIDGKPEGTFACPTCGVSDSHENIMREIGDYTRENMVHELSRTLERATRGSKFLTLKKRHRPKKVYRFIIDLDLH